MKQNLRVRSRGYDERYKSWHTLHRNMLLYIHQGTGSIVSKEKNYPIAPHALCFVGSDTFYYTLPDMREPYERSKLFLSDEELSKILSLIGGAIAEEKRFSSRGILYAQLNEEAAKEAERLFDRLGAHEGEECLQNAFLLSAYIRLLADLFENAVDTAFPNEDMVQKAVEYVNKHISEEITIDGICAAIHVSKYYFCRKFKEHTGLTVMNYILKTRIVSAKNMLEDPKHTMSEVSEQCGFSSQSYFSRVFKEEAGLTPLQYRKKLLSE